MAKIPARNGNKPATRVDLGKLRTEMGKMENSLRDGIRKVDLKVDRVAAALVRTETNLRKEIREQGLATKEDFGRVLSAIDAFARKTLSHADILQGHEARLRGHARRISTLEGPR